MKTIHIVAALALTLMSFSSLAVAKSESGHVTLRGEIVDGDSSCTLTHQEIDQAVELQKNTAAKISIKISRCAEETFENITATFGGREAQGNSKLLAIGEAAAVKIRDCNGNSVDIAKKSGLSVKLSKDKTFDFSAELAGSLPHHSTISGITHLTLAYQ